MAGNDTTSNAQDEDDPYRTGPRASLPVFLSEAGITGDVRLPDRMAGLYVTAGRENGTDTYRRLAVVTSQGWVPPVPTHTVNMIKEDFGADPNSVASVECLAVNRRKRVVWHPCKLRNTVGAEQEIVPNGTTSSILRTGENTDINYYVPDVEPARVGAYLSQALRCVIVADYSDTDPTIEQLSTRLQDYYPVSEQEAIATIRHAARGSKREDCNTTDSPQLDPQGEETSRGAEQQSKDEEIERENEHPATGSETPDSPNGMKLPGNANSIAEIDDLEFSWEDPPTTQFADIGGYRDVKQQLKDSVIKPLRDSDNSYSRFNVEPARGLLFHGPPGTGKTLFARALANALHRPFVELTQASLTHHHINKSPQLIDQMFAEAEELHGVIFVDEAEQLVGNRNMQGNQHAEDNKITNTFLSALTQEDKSFILLLTTNMRDAIDDAILRPGRIDKQIKIGYPDASTRAKILKLKLLDVPQNVNAEYIDKIAARCEQWSGADLEALASTAKRHAAERKAESLSKEDLAYGFTEVYDGSVME